MFLKCIEMTGFKSFPEKTVMQLNGSITGVVGPNGSGKSNVSDAVRWVLGEQSAKTLRGSVMQDVIFAGTQKRTPRSYCEVTLIFDNHESKMNTAYSEIQVTRKLYRSGESEYYLNRTKCRLKDILNMFRDTGIGKEGYSIIGQGKIDEILSEKSIERRQVFEEASGIMKYRVRKEEAERKLERTRQNLVRIEDILNEQNLMIEPLKIQAENAAEYLKLSERLKGLDVSLFFNLYEKSTARTEKLNQTITDLKEEHGRKETLLKELDAQLSDEQENLRRLEKEGDLLAQNLSGSLAETERIEGEIKLCGERMANLQKESARLAQEIIETKEKVASLHFDETKNADRIAQIGREEDAHRQFIQETNQALASLNDVFEDRMKVIEAVQIDKMETIEKTSDLKNAVFSMEEKERRLINVAQDLENRIAHLSDQQKKNTEAQSLQKETLFTYEKNRGEQLEAYNEKVFLRNSVSEQVDKISEALEKMRTEHAACVSSAKILQDMKHSFEGYQDSVRKLMTAARKNVELSKRMIGPFADLIKVPQNLENAIEACLGPALQNIVVNSEYDAKQAISFLRENQMGRVTFLPLQALKIRHLSEQENNVLKENGVLGTAIELISFDESIRAAAEFLLGRTVIVKDSDTAIRIMRAYQHAFRVVTLDGDIFHLGGTITGGSLRKQRSTIVSRDRLAQEMSEKIDKLANDISEQEDALQTQKHIRDQIIDEIEAARKKLNEYEISIAAEKEKEAVLISAAKEMETSARQWMQEKEAKEVEAAETKSEKAQISARLEDARQSAEQRNEDYKKLEEDYRDNAEKIEELKKKLHETEIAVAELLKERESLQKTNEKLATEIVDASKAIKIREATRTLNDQSLENLENLKDELTALLAQKTQMAKDTKERHGDMLKRRDENNETLSEKNKKISGLKDELSGLTEKILRAEFNIEKTQAGIQSAQNKLWDNYQLTYANAVPYRQDIDVSVAEAETDKIRQQIRGMGNINPNAIDDYSELKERMESLSDQKDDLCKAAEDLHALIDSLLSEMKKVFKSSFEQINRYFKETFVELFDGGSAQLLLEDGKDIMECGIEIVAEPPGKKLQNISLLSGGEKALTAISLLFALLKINPSPVCVLDEIDAALDEANVNKFAEYLRKYAGVMQFIVITHRRATMVVCDSLYGFAMEEKGVSKLLSVRLN